ncbi:MAG: hypothetical protein SFT91_03885 [Rickettsiaceae bacterium]|nr:hypothetical protein [Rickettsiaceae bacterium]
MDKLDKNAQTIVNEQWAIIEKEIEKEAELAISKAQTLCAQYITAVGWEELIAQPENSDPKLQTIFSEKTNSGIILHDNKTAGERAGKFSLYDQNYLTLFGPEGNSGTFGNQLKERNKTITNRINALEGISDDEKKDIIDTLKEKAKTKIEDITTQTRKEFDISNANVPSFVPKVIKKEILTSADSSLSKPENQEKLKYLMDNIMITDKFVEEFLKSGPGIDTAFSVYAEKIRPLVKSIKELLDNESDQDKLKLSSQLNKINNTLKPSYSQLTGMVSFMSPRSPRPPVAKQESSWSLFSGGASSGSPRPGLLNQASSFFSSFINPLHNSSKSTSTKSNTSGDLSKSTESSTPSDTSDSFVLGAIYKSSENSNGRNPSINTRLTKLGMRIEELFGPVKDPPELNPNAPPGTRGSNRMSTPNLNNGKNQL